MVVAGSHALNFQIQDANGVGSTSSSSSSKDYHVVDIEVTGAGARGATVCCVVCTEPLEWVAVGRCGHCVVCSKCMIRIRHVNGDKSCCVCRAVCPNVMVTRADGGTARVVSAFKEYWYHAKTAAYFDDERQYQAATEACRKKLSPYYHYYHPLYMSIPLFVGSIIIGAVLGSAFADETKHMAMKVLAYPLSILFCMSLISFMWFRVKCQRDPDEEEIEEDEEEMEDHEPQIARVTMPLEQQLHAAHLEMKNHDSRTKI